MVFTVINNKKLGIGVRMKESYMNGRTCRRLEELKHDIFRVQQY